MNAHRRLLTAPAARAIPATPVAWPWTIHPSAKLFADAQGQIVRWLGAGAFRALDRFSRGEDQLFGWHRRCYPRANILRVWPYVPWSIDGWDAPPPSVARSMLTAAAAAGFNVELTLLTDSQPRRIPWAVSYVEALAADPPSNLLIEIGNEPEYNNIDVNKLYDCLRGTPFLWASGRYMESSQIDNLLGPGRYGTAHTGRTADFARRGHDLLEYWTGAGPDIPHLPARKPWVGDEPIRPDQVVAGQPGGVISRLGAFKTLGAVYALFGAGGTFHAECCKQAREPNSDEQQCADAYFAGLTALPLDAALGSYGGTLKEDPRVDEGRSYPVGNWLVRCYPATLTPPAGWTAIDPDSIICRRASS